MRRELVTKSRVDAISLRHLPRRSIKNCELHSANVARQTDRLKTNYSVDDDNNNMMDEESPVAQLIDLSIPQ